MAIILRTFCLTRGEAALNINILVIFIVNSMIYTYDEAELPDRPGLSPRKLPWCETEEEYEAAIADLAAQDSRWS